MRLREVLGLLDVTGRCGDLRQRGEHRPGSQATEHGSQRDSAGADQQEDQAQVLEDVVDAVERACEQDRPRLLRSR